MLRVFNSANALLNEGYKDIDDLFLPLYTNYSDFYLSNGVYDSAYYYLLRYVELNRKKLNKESNEQIQQLFVRYETEKKKKRSSHSEQKLDRLR